MTIRPEPPGLMHFSGTSPRNWIVGMHRTDADEHRVGLPAPPVREAACARVADPPRLAVLVRNFAIHTLCNFEGDERQARGNKFEKALIQLTARFGEQTGFDHDTAFTQHLYAAAIDQRIGVDTSQNHAGNACFNYAIDTRRGFPEVAAGLERAVQYGVAGQVPGFTQRLNFSMVAAEFAVIACAHDLAVAHHHRTDHGIGANKPAPTQRQLNGFLEEFSIRL